MLKRESERLVEPSPGFFFPPANSTCIVVVLFIVWKFLWFFFLMCSTHQPHWANKGKRMFQIYFCFSYLSSPNSWYVSRISTWYLLITIRFPFWIFLPAFPYSWMDFSSKVMCTFCVLPCLLANGKGIVVISIMGSEMRLHSMDELCFSTYPWEVCISKYKPLPLVRNLLNI